MKPGAFRPRLSYANVTATLALVVALGGGAYAATRFVASNGTIRACVTSKGQLSVVKPGRRCGKGKTRVAWNARGRTGAPGAPGSALAYAHVNADGSLDAAHSKNVVSVAPQLLCVSTCYPQSDSICFQVTKPVTNAVVTPDFKEVGNVVGGETPVARVELSPNLSPAVPFTCPASQPSSAVHMSNQTGAAKHFGFYIAFN